MPSPELCTEAEVAELVSTFYAKVRDDAILGPIFERHVADWNLHMPKMIAFWSAALRGSSNYRGNPMVVHRALPNLTQSMFERWLDLFHESASALPNRAMAERAGELSQRIAQSLWYGYQLQREPDRLPASLPQQAKTGQATSVSE
ncbi:MAG: group III truncated hemoglobin [Acidobacteriota bacterium]